MQDEKPNLHALHVQLIEISGRVERVCARQEDIACRQEVTAEAQEQLNQAFDQQIRGVGQEPGLIGRVDRLEQSAKRRTKWAAAVWAVIISVLGGLASSVWGK